MAVIHDYVLCRHVRAESTNHLLAYKNGRLKRSGRGIAFWFMPLATSLAEVPVDDRELSFIFHVRSADFQDVTVQGLIVYRVSSPETLSERVDFSLDPRKGQYLKQPLQQLGVMLTELAQQLAQQYVSRFPVRGLMERGLGDLRQQMDDGLSGDDSLTAMGLSLVSLRISSIKPAADLEKALEMPTREAIQQQADEARFQRRALAVEKERAIRENELQNEIELARREETLIEQRGQNERRRMTEDAEAQRIATEAGAARTRLEADAQAAAIETVEAAQVTQERARIDIYRDLPASVMAGLAARELAGKLHTIEHLNISPELLGPSLLRLVQAGTDKLEDAS